MNSFIERLISEFPKSKVTFYGLDRNVPSFKAIKIQLTQTLGMRFFRFKARDVPQEGQDGHGLSCECQVSETDRLLTVWRNEFVIPDFELFALNMALIPLDSFSAIQLETTIKKASSSFSFTPSVLTNVFRVIKHEGEWMRTRGNLKVHLAWTEGRFVISFVPKPVFVSQTGTVRKAVTFYNCESIEELAKLVKVLNEVVTIDDVICGDVKERLKKLVGQTKLDMVATLVESIERLPAARVCMKAIEKEVSATEPLAFKQPDLRLSDVREDLDAKHMSKLRVAFMRAEFLKLLTNIRTEAAKGERCFTYAVNNVDPEFIPELERRGFVVKKVDTGFKVSW